MAKKIAKIYSSILYKYSTLKGVFHYFSIYRLNLTVTNFSVLSDLNPKWDCPSFVTGFFTRFTCEKTSQFDIPVPFFG